MNYFVAPRSGEKSHKNFESTIKNGIPLERIRPYLTEEEIGILSKEEIIYAWGNRQGTASAWYKMNNGDLVIFYAHKRLIMTGEVYFKKHNPEMALALWPPDDNGHPWEYVFFIKNIKFISIPISTFNLAVDYKINNVIQGFTYLHTERINKIIQRYGSVEKMLGLFTDEYSEEIPLESEKVYVNIPKEIIPIITTQISIHPRIEVPYQPQKGKKKIDYIKRNIENSITGSKGEELVLKVERERLQAAGKPELADQVERLSKNDDSIGFDILSFEINGEPRRIEVKTTCTKNNFIRFFVTHNEYSIGQSIKNYFIYYVEDVNSTSPKITIIQNPIDNSKFLIKPDGYIFEAER